MSENFEISENEKIFTEILPEISRFFENRNFSNSLNIFITDVEIVDEDGGFMDEKNDQNSITFNIEKFKITAKFKNCVAVRQKKISTEEEMMFGVFEQNDLATSNTSPEVTEIHPRLILPEDTVIPVRNYRIPENKKLTSILAALFGCEAENIRISQKPSDPKIFLHVDLEKEHKTPRSSIFEAAYLLIEFFSLENSENFKQKLRKINKIVLPFVHFGKVRISIDFTKGVVKMFNLYGTLFGVLEFFGSEEHFDNVFVPEERVFGSSNFQEDEEQHQEVKNQDYPKDQPSQSLLHLLQIVEHKMSISTSSTSSKNHVATTPLPYLGIDSLRLAELEFHVAQNEHFRELSLRSPFLMRFKTLEQIAEFLEEELGKLTFRSAPEANKVLGTFSEKSEIPNYRIPLSAEQKRILYVAELERIEQNMKENTPKSQFLESIVLKLGEHLDVQKIEDILNVLILKHTILRTGYCYQDQYQYLKSGTECYVAVLMEDNEAFDINYEFSCFKKMQKDHLELHLNFHHIMIDGRSLSIFYKQFLQLYSNPELYTAYSKPGHLLQYHDYCREKEKEPVDHRDEEFWKKYFESVESEDMEDLFPDFNFHVAKSVRKVFPPNVKVKFDEMTRELGISKFEIFFEILEPTVRKVFGISKNFTIGFAQDQRKFEFLETIGCFTNVIPYISKSSESDLNSLKELRAHGALDYQSIKKIGGKAAEFQIFVVSDVVEVQEVQEHIKKPKSVRFSDDVTFEVMTTSREDVIAKYPMTFYLRQNAENLLLEVEYAENLVKKDTVDFLCNQVFKSINRRVYDLNLNINLNFDDKKIQKSDFPRFTVIQNLSNFNSKPSKLQDLKLKYRNKNLELTYPEVFHVSRNLLKHHLKVYGQRVLDHPVLVKLPRGPDLLNVVFATWHAGFYPVPLHMGIKEKGIKITKIGLLAPGALLIDEKVLKTLEKNKTEKSRSIFNTSTIFDFCYVTSTSGSTGVPKLVGTSFEGHSNLSLQYTKRFNLNFDDVICQTVDPSFDIFFADIFKTFVNGARLLLCQDAIPSSEELSACSNAYIMPALIARLFSEDHHSEEKEEDDLSNLKSLQYGGESLAPKVIQNIFKRYKELRIFQEFGLTEQTVYSTCQRVRLGSMDAHNLRNVGEPYNNIGIVLNAPKVCEAQLILTGVGIMRGYFGITKHVLKSLETGDIGKRDFNGHVEFVGRKDSQVKVRGHRVDLFEIECSAISSEVCEQCACVISSDDKNSIFLFYTPKKMNMDSIKMTKKLMSHLENELISYKVPRGFVQLEQFPLTRTGKIDRKALKEMLKKELCYKISTTETSKKNITSTSFVKNSVKKWLEHYSQSKIPSDDVDIFTQGVDSITVMLTMQKLRSEGVEVPVKVFFEKKTLKSIGEWVRNAPESSETDTDKFVSSETPRHHYIDLNHIQERILFLTRISNTETSENVFRMEFTIPVNSLDDENLKVMLNTVIQNNPMLRSNLARENGKFKFFLLSATESFRSLAPASRNFDFRRNPFETLISKISNTHLKISIHHLICDGRSLKILRDQLESFEKLRSTKIHLSFDLPEQPNIEKMRNLLNPRSSKYVSKFSNFEFGANFATKIHVDFNFFQESLSPSEVFYSYGKAIQKVVLGDVDFPIACTFSNRSTENWDTVGMFANTLPVFFENDHGNESAYFINDPQFKIFKTRLQKINENANIPLMDILSSSNHSNQNSGMFADFAINFHRSLDDFQESKSRCQFAMILTYSKTENAGILEFDESIISKENAENLKRSILEHFGNEDEDLGWDYRAVFQRFLKLNLSEISDDTDFFMNGGHSLTAMQLIDYVSDELGVELPLRMIFENSTPRKLREAVGKWRNDVGGEDDHSNDNDHGNDNYHPNDNAIDHSNDNDHSNAIDHSNVVDNEHLNDFNHDHSNAHLNDNDHSIAPTFQYPLSPQQLQMFYLSEFSPDSLEYQLPFIQPFPSTVSPQQIHHSLLCTMQEQSIFRTGFFQKAGDPYQEVLSITECFICCHVEMMDDKEMMHSRIRELCEEHIQVLSGVSLMRATFLMMKEHQNDNAHPIRHVAFLHLHHLISDARSTQLTNYTMRKFLETPKLFPTRPQFHYKDYCMRQNVGEENDEKMQNFRNSENLKSLVEGMKLWNTVKNPQIREPSKCSMDVLEISNTSKSPFYEFLRATSSVLCRKFHVENLNLTFPVLNRNSTTSNICGYFLNNLIINSSKIEDLATVIQNNLQYSQVIREIRQLTMSTEEVSGIYINCRYDLEFDETDDMELLELVPMKMHFPVEIDIDLMDGFWRLTMRSSLFSRLEIQETLKEVKDVLGNNVQNSLRMLENNSGNLKNSSRTITNSILSGPKKDYPSLPLPLLYQQFFTSSTSIFSENLSTSETLTYPKTLSLIQNSSYQISKMFLKCNCAPLRSDDIIGIVAEKSVSTTILCLSVQYSGAAYLPVDQKYPEERKKEILKDATWQLEGLEKREDCRRHHWNLAVRESLAYVITTSGSTGKPKSVAISGFSVANLALCSTVFMRVTRESRIFQFTNFVFDNSVLEIIMALGSGARLVYPDAGELFDPQLFSSFLSDPLRITHCLLFPSLVSSFSPRILDSLKNLGYWIVGGERLPQHLLDTVLNFRPAPTVIQNYGPTETTAFCVVKTMRKTNQAQWIGMPGFNTKIRVLESSELLISGAGKMRGYLNQDPKIEKGSGHWYHSGDLCKITDNGELEFVGRTDSQIKIRGYRVELSEIETTIESIPSIATCKAYFQQETQQIHVFYTVSSELTGEQVREYCQRFLEPQKIPASFTKIREFPLTRNSKIDKKKLMGMLENIPENIANNSKMLENTSLELSRIWKTLLNCPSPSGSDHFFLIGGHSLLLIKLRYEIDQHLGVHLSVPELLENLEFSKMVKIVLDKKTPTVSESESQNVKKTIVFFPALYGGCTGYLKLVDKLKMRNFEILLLDEEFGDTVDDVAIKYKRQIEEKKIAPSSIFLGASSGGTFAHATWQLLKLQYPETTVILLDTGTFWDLIGNLKYEEHEKEMLENLKSYQIDPNTVSQMARASWKTLQILKNYEPKSMTFNYISTTAPPPKVHILSIDGTDLGWSKYSGNLLKIYKIPGDHYSMLQDDGHLEEIVKIVLSI